jgi:hypothetical protein
MTRTKKSLIAGAFLAAAGATGAAFMQADAILDKSLEHNSYAGGWAATRLLRADIDGGTHPQTIAFNAAAGNEAYVRLALDLGAGEKTRALSHANAALGPSPILFSEKEMTSERQKEKMLELIESYAKSRVEKQAMRDGTLEQTVSDDNVEIVKYLLDKGANPNADSHTLQSMGITAPRTLAWAAMNPSGEIANLMVDTLLRHGADTALAMKYLNELYDNSNGDTDIGDARALIVYKNWEVKHFDKPQQPAMKP